MLYLCIFFYFSVFTFCPFAQAAIWATHLSITPATLSLRSPFHVRWTSVPTDRTRATSPHGSPPPCCQHVVPVTSPALDHATSFFQSKAAPHEESSGRRCVRASEREGLSRSSLAAGAEMMTWMAMSFESRPCLAEICCSCCTCV